MSMKSLVAKVPGMIGDTKVWTVRELLDEYNRLRGLYTANEKDRDSVHHKLFDGVAQLDKSADEVQKYYEGMRKEYRAIKANSELLRVAMRGIEGAVDYYFSSALSDVLPVVMKCYTGKRAGSKTQENFTADVSAALARQTGVQVKCRFGSGDRAYFYGDDIPSHFRLSSGITLLTDRENRYRESVYAYTQMDAFNGEYPDDWVCWAEVVMEVNRIMREEYKEFVQANASIVNQLSVGNTEFNRVYEYQMKMRG